jgi:hypothetical protein
MMLKTLVVFVDYQLVEAVVFMAELEFVNKLIKEGKLRQLEYPWHEYYLIVDRPGLMLKQDYEFVTEPHMSYTKYGNWNVWTHRYTIHVKTLKKPLQSEWARLDYNKLEAEQRRLDEWFSNLPDY